MSSFSAMSYANRKKRDPLQEYLDQGDPNAMFGPKPTEPLRPLGANPSPVGGQYDSPVADLVLASAKPTPTILDQYMPDPSGDPVSKMLGLDASPTVKAPVNGGPAPAGIPVASDAASEYDKMMAGIANPNAGLGLDRVDPQKVRQTRQQLSREIRHAEAQNLQQRRALASQRQQALNEGRPDEAAALMQEIQSLANSTRDDRANLKGLLQLERGITPPMSDERRQAGRDALNAQLPAVRGAIAADQAQAQQEYQDRLAQVGGKAVRLETGMSPDAYDPQVLAQFASTASPDVVDRVTRGVGLPPAPGTDALKAVDDLISAGGIDFGAPTGSAPPSRDAMQAALTFMGNAEADRNAQETIRDANRNVAVGSARANEAQVNESLRQMGLDVPQSPDEMFGPPAPSGGRAGGGQPSPVSLLEMARRTDPQIFAVDPETGEMGDSERLLADIESGNIGRTLSLAAEQGDTKQVSKILSRITQLISTPGLSPGFRRTLASQVLPAMEGVSVQAPGGTAGFWDVATSMLGEAVDNPFGPLGDVLSGDFRLTDTVQNVNRRINAEEVEAQGALEALRNRLRSITNG